jgi:hypothetical protein
MAVGIRLDDGTNSTETLCEVPGILTECHQINSGECTLDIRR